MKTITEGKAKVKVYTGKISKELPVFYNPVMKVNRDISVLLLNSLGKNGLRIALPLAGTGIRGIRLKKELEEGVMKSLHLNDSNPEAVKLIKQNLKLNGIKEVKVGNKDANEFLLEGSGFNYIDVDPFGTPNPFLDSAVKRLSREGILAVTATDTGCLCGTYPEACLRKYWAKPVKNEFMHETGLRILIRKVQLIGAQYDRALTPIFSYSKDHYFRIFLKSDKGKTKVDRILQQHGFILYCSRCLNRTLSKSILNKSRCECGSSYDFAGPLWLGNLFLLPLIINMLENNKDDQLSKFLELVLSESEINAVGFFDIHKVCKTYKLKLKKNEEILKNIRKSSLTHFTGRAIKADISVQELVKYING